MTANCRCVKYYATVKSTAKHTAHTRIIRDVILSIYLCRYTVVPFIRSYTSCFTCCSSYALNMLLSYTTFQLSVPLDHSCYTSLPNNYIQLNVPPHMRTYPPLLTHDYMLHIIHVVSSLIYVSPYSIYLSIRSFTPSHRTTIAIVPNALAYTSLLFEYVYLVHFTVSATHQLTL